MVKMQARDVQVREDPSAIEHSHQKDRMSLVDTKRFRRSSRLQSILGILRDGRAEESNLSGLTTLKTGASPETPYNGHRVMPDQTRGPVVESRTERNDGIRQGHKHNEDRTAPESPEQAVREATREDLIRERINVAVMDSMASSEGSEHKKVMFSSKSQESPNKEKLKVKIGETVIEGNRIASPRSPQNGKSSPRDGRNESSRNTMPRFFNSKSNPSESESSDDQGSFDRRKSASLTKRGPAKGSPRSVAKKVPSKSLAIESKSISSDDTDRGSISSSDSSGSDYMSSSSDDGYSTGSSLKPSKKKYMIDTQVRVEDKPKEVTSPIAEQASEFINKLVRNLQLQQTFGMPDKIRKQTKSRPINRGDGRSEEEEEGSSILIDRSNKEAHPLKAPSSLPQGNLMDELREKLATRAQKIEASTHTGIADEKANSDKTGKPKSSSQLSTDTPNDAEMIPHFVSGDTTSTRVQLEPTSGACVTFMACFGDDAEVRKPLRVRWQEGEFLAVEDNLDAASTMASTEESQGRKPSIEELLVLGKSWSNVATKQVPEDSKIGVLNHTLSSGSDETWEEAVVIRDEDSTSLAYSLATQEAREQQLSPSCSEDSSMVPLKHGERERIRPSLPRHHEKEMPESSDELAIALSLSGESNNLIPSPLNNKAERRLKDPAEIHENPLAQERMQYKNSTPSHLAAQRDEEHQEELATKIQLFQQRKTQAMEAGQSPYESSLPSKNIQRLPARSDAELPRASRKIAQAYVDALSKKKGDQTWPTAMPKNESIANALSGKAPLDSTKPPSTVSPEDVIPAPELYGTGKNGQSQPQSRSLSQLHEGNVKNVLSSGGNCSMSSAKSAQEAVFNNVGDLVSRIDTVVQRLVQSGKINVDAGPSRGSELEKKTMRDNAVELLQNLAILRARRDSGSSSRLGISKSFSFSANGVVDVPKSIPIKALTIPAPRESQTPPHLLSVPQEENSTLERLRAKRDQAAMDVRNRAARLRSLSRDSSSHHGNEENPIIVDNPGSGNNVTLQKDPIEMGIGRSLSSAKVHGPPKPESSSKRAPSSPSLGAISRHTGTQILRVEDRVKAGNRHTFAEIGSKLLTYNVDSWEQEQLKELAVLLKPTFSGNQHEKKGEDHSLRNNTTSQRRSSDHTGTKAWTVEDDLSFSNEDEATDYGSDDDSKQMDRIESMIQELRARRLRL